MSQDKLADGVGGYCVKSKTKGLALSAISAASMAEPSMIVISMPAGDVASYGRGFKVVRDEAVFPELAGDA